MTRITGSVFTRRLIAVAGTSTLLAGGLTSVANAAPASAAAPSYVVAPRIPLAISLGDSFISGEGGRFAGSVYDSRESDEAADKGPHNKGDQSYRDAWGGRDFKFGQRIIKGPDTNLWCHRSDSAEIQSTKNAMGWIPVNLACSGAESSDVLNDTYRTEDPQVKQLAKIAKDPRYEIKSVVVSIGGNDLGFSDLIGDLVQITDTNSPTDQKLKNKLNPFVKKKTIWESYAEDIPDVKKKITKTLNTISDVMRSSGYKDDSYRFVYQSYSNLFAGSSNRYMAVDSSRQMDRFESPGVPMSNASVDYSRSVMVPALTNMTYQAMKASENKSIQFMNLTNAFQGHELSSKDTEQVLSRHKKAPNPATAEWVVPINSNFVAGAAAKTERHQESFHPNRFGQEAYGTCLVAALKSNERELTCVGQAGKPPSELLISYGGGKLPGVPVIESFIQQATAPSAPRIVQLNDGTDGVAITMESPANDGGAMITDFEYSTDGGGSWSGVKGECICILLRSLAKAHVTKSFNIPVQATWTITRQSVPGNPKLAPGEAYKVRVRAVNSVGPGKASNTMSARLLAPMKTEPELSV